MVCVCVFMYAIGLSCDPGNLFDATNLYRASARRRTTLHEETAKRPSSLSRDCVLPLSLSLSIVLMSRLSDERRCDVPYLRMFERLTSAVDGCREAT